MTVANHTSSPVSIPIPLVVEGMICAILWQHVLELLLELRVGLKTTDDRRRVGIVTVLMQAAWISSSRETSIPPTRLELASPCRMERICSKVGRWFGLSLQHQHMSSTIWMECGHNCVCGRGGGGGVSVI